MFRRFLRDRRGQGLVELALVLPVFIALVFGTISFIWAFEAKVVVTNAARAVARFVSVSCDPSSPGWDPNWITDAESLGGQALKDGALFLQPGMYPSPFTPGTQPAGTWYVGVQCPNPPSQPVSAYVEYNQTNLFPPLSIMLGQSSRMGPGVFTLQVTATYPAE